MFRNHPKGVYVAFVTNMGERFGFYTMMAVLSLFLQSKFGFSVSKTGDIYSWFYFAVFASALLGGLFADWVKQYKSTILIGLIMMIIGYIIMAIPSLPFYGTLITLFLISLGNGFFKGNLQAVVAQLYEDEKYAKYKDTAYTIFYIGVNIGALFAPFIVSYIRDWWLATNGLAYNSTLPALCNQYLAGDYTHVAQLAELAKKATPAGQTAINLYEFAGQYKQVFTKGYNLAIGFAAIIMVVSLLVYIIHNKTLPNKSVERKIKKVGLIDNKRPKQNRKLITITLLITPVTIILFSFIQVLDFYTRIGSGLAIGIFLSFISYIFFVSTDEERPNVVTLILLYVVVIFFWMSINQNGLVLTQFAVEFIDKEVSPFTYLFFDLKSILCLLSVVSGMVLLFHFKSTLRRRLIGAMVIIVFGGACFYFVKTGREHNTISPEIFQSFNPLFIILLMPFVIWFFSFLRDRGVEPSTPKKIGIGLIIAGLGFVILLIGSLNLMAPNDLHGASAPKNSLISPYWLVSSYLVITVAEIFLSPMGISFVSKVAPKRFQGLMLGGWLYTTAVGNKFLFVGSYLWEKVSLWVLWAIFAGLCMLSSVIIFSNIKRLERPNVDKPYPKR